MTLGEIFSQFEDEEHVARLAPDLGDAEWQARAAVRRDGSWRNAWATMPAPPSSVLPRPPSAEDWVSLMSALNRAADPGRELPAADDRLVPGA